VKARVLLERCARHIARRKLMEWIMVVVICWRGMIYYEGGGESARITFWLDACSMLAAQDNKQT
jgi:hypothetical protein